MLEHEETLEYIKAAQTGDNSAKTQLLEHNMPLIKSIVRRYRNKHVEYDDLMQLGALGLIKAVQNFDSSYGVRFSTYAVPMIAGEIKRFIRDDGAIKVSRAIKTQAMNINRYVEEYRQTHDETPRVKQIAEKFNICEQEVVVCLDSSKYPVSIYDKFDDENGKSLADKLPAKETQDDVMDKLIIKDLIKNLPERERMIITLRYYKDKTQSEIARILGVSQVQVSRLESKIIGKMKEAFIS